VLPPLCQFVRKALASVPNDIDPKGRKGITSFCLKSDSSIDGAPTETRDRRKQGHAMT
jgi:hypothetical protein